MAATKRPAKRAAKSVSKRPMIYLSHGLEIRPEPKASPVTTTPDGRPVVAWARVGVVHGRAGAPKSWLAQLAGTEGHLTRAFVEHAKSHKLGNKVICEDPFMLESYRADDHPLAAGVYEGSSTFRGGPPGYQGRVAFDVRDDGTIEILGVGTRDRPLPRDVQETIAARIRGHAGRDGADQIRARQAEREGEASVESDEMIARYGFPDLEGTAKQVKWAMDIRRRAFQELVRDDKPEHWVAVVCTQKSAKWWIDHRDRATSLLRQMR
jgi:hypothetical protein